VSKVDGKKGELVASTVYVVQENSQVNMLPATQWGKIRILIPEDRQITFSPDDAVLRMKHALKDFTRDDFVLALGDPTAIGIACAVAANKTGGFFSMLKWDRQQRCYYRVDVDLNVGGEFNADDV